jgi:preprotein translocase subunit Sec63
MDGLEYQEIITAEVRARRTAERVLGVDESASLREIRRAWRKRCLETHPDHNPDDPDAERKFRLVNCAYRLLTDGSPCDELLTQGAKVERTPLHGRYNIFNAWGFYLWWRETFF